MAGSDVNIAMEIADVDIAESLDQSLEEYVPSAQPEKCFPTLVEATSADEMSFEAMLQAMIDKELQCHFCSGLTADPGLWQTGRGMRRMQPLGPTAS